MSETYKNIHELKQGFPALNKCAKAYVVPCSSSLRKNNLEHIQKNRSAYWVIAESELVEYADNALLIAIPTESGKDREIYVGVISGKPKKDPNYAKYIIPVAYLNNGKAVCTLPNKGYTAFYDGASPQTKSPVLVESWQSDKKPSDLKSDINQLLTDTELSDTEKKTLLMARIGQGKFRQNVLARAGYRCDVTGFDKTHLLLASHVLPWARCESSTQRLDANNGLLLTPNLDRLFDEGLITFDSNGAMLSLTEHLSALLQLAPTVFDGNDKLRKKPNPKQQEYLEKHMEIFKLKDALHVLDIPRRKSRTKLRKPRE